MANVQKYFEEFHETIRVDYDAIRGKRDIILDRLRKHLKDKNRPNFDELHQGSYAMGVGIAPMGELEYDLDIGLRFQISARDYSAEKVYGWVFEGVQGHTDKVEQKGHCVRVAYAQGDFHVDLVCYSWEKDNSGIEIFKLAHKTKGWLPGNPPGLLMYVEQKRKPFEETKDSRTQTDQFRRCVRYLKRWNDCAIPVEGDNKPTGLSFVLLCADWLQPRFFIDGKPDDLTALRNLTLSASAVAGRIVAMKPTPEYEDILLKLTADDMDAFKNRFKILSTVLENAAREADPVKACALLLAVFGDDFPAPTPDDTAKKTAAPAIITSSSSA